MAKRKAKEPSIRLSPKYGVNATIPLCFWCGEEKGEIVMLGRIGKGDEDIEAPRHMLIDYHPCDKCASKMAKGITLIGVSDNEKYWGDRPQIRDGLWPTGMWTVIPEEGAAVIFNEPERTEILKSRKVLIDIATLSSWLHPDDQEDQ